MQIQRSPEVHDVIVIGSGAAGGMAAWNLARKGVNVLVLDAGEKFDRAKFWSHVKPWEWEPRLARGQYPPQFYLDLKDQPYTWEEGHYFQLTRVWGRGGKQTFGAVYRYATPISTLPNPSVTVGRFPGRFATKTSRRITTAWNNS